MSIVNSVKGFVRTITGVLPLTLEGCVDEKSIIDYTIYGNSVQDGTPTPDTPVEVESVGEKTKNLFNYADYTTLTSYNGNDISANWLTIDGDLFYIKYDYYNGGCWLTPTKQWGLLAGTYTLSGKCKDNTIKENPNICYCGIRWSDDTRNAGWGKINSNDGEWYNFSYTFTITEDKTVKGIYLQNNGATAKSSICFTNIQLEEGSTATDYEPYGYKIPIKVSGKNLLSPQKWVSGQHLDGIIVYPNVDYITSMGENYIEANLAAWQGVASEKFEYAKVNTVGFKINKNRVVDDYTIYYIGLQGYDVDGKKTIFKQLSTSVVADKEYVFKKNNGDFVFGLTTKSVRLCILSRSQAITGLRVYDFYSTNDTATTYEPYHEPITTNIYLDEPLGAGQSINYKKDGLPTIPTFKGTSIISADTTVQPSNAEIEYYSNVKE